jgi:uncharacterized protein (DUF4415 family)
VCHSTTVFEADHNGLVTKAVTVADDRDKKASASADVAYVYAQAIKPIFEAARAAGTMPPMVDRAGMAGAFEHVPLELAQNAGAATVAAVTRTRHAWVSTLLARHIGFEGKPLASLVRYFFRVAVWAGGAGARKKKEGNKTEEKKEKREKKAAAAAAGALAAIPERGAGEIVLPKRKRGGPQQRRPKCVRVDTDVVEAVDAAAADQEREAGGDFATIDMLTELEALAVHEGCAKARVTVAVGDVPPSRSPVVQALAEDVRAALVELACRYSAAVPRLLAADAKKAKKPPAATPMTAAFVSLWQRHLQARMAFAASVRERGCV